MPTICFDVLIPDEFASAPEDLGATFRRALDILTQRGRLTSGNVFHERAVEVDPGVVTELRDVYERDHDGREPGEANMHRYLIEAAGESVSYNELAMGLSRILQPKADLPKDPVALERQLDFEAPAIYPWTVEIRR